MIEFPQFNYALDTLYLLFSACLVMSFIAGLGLFTAGMVRAKNHVDILVKTLILVAIGYVGYVLLGYSVMYGVPYTNHISIPSFSGGEQTLLQLLSKSKPHTFFAGLFLQSQLAIIPLIIIAGATAERIKPWVLWLFAVVFIGIIYPVQGYWTWGQGFLEKIGFIDAAGSGVIHLTGAVAALIAVLMLGPRTGKYGLRSEIYPLQGANLALATLGIWLVWLGSFGITTSSQHVLSNITNAQIIATIAVNTQTAMAASIIAVLIVSRLLLGTIDLTFILNGALSGVVAISASPASYGVISALLVGGLSGIFVILAILLFDRLKIDDPVGAIATHGVGGLWGLIAVIFTQNYSTLTTSYGYLWKWYHQLSVQLCGIASILVWVLISSFVVLGLFKLLFGIRINENMEHKGLDVIQYGTPIYSEFGRYP